MAFKSFLEKYFTFFVYASLFFVVLFLIRYDYFALDFKNVHYAPLLLSFLFLFLGCLANAYSWYGVCRLATDNISRKEGISSHGLSVFGKYIPGKIWTVLGRAAYLSRTGVPAKQATQLSFYAQMVSVWTGLTVGMVTLIWSGINLIYILLAFLLWAVLGLILLIPFFVSSPGKRLSLFFIPKRNNEPGLSTLKSFLKRLPPFFTSWLLWTTAFYFLMVSVTLYFNDPWYTAFSFPLAATLGILAIVFPGGLGVREGFLAFFLMNHGLSFEVSTLISISSRIWFTIGEIFIFAVALFLKYKGSQKNSTEPES